MGCGASNEAAPAPPSSSTPAPAAPPPEPVKPDPAPAPAPAPTPAAAPEPVKPAPEPVAEPVKAAADPAPAAAPGGKYDYSELYSKNYLNVPRLPIPSLDNTCAKYMASINALGVSEEEVAKHAALVESFRTGAGAKLQAKLEESDAANAKAGAYPHSYIEKLWDEMYNGLRCPAPVNVSPYFGITDSKNKESQARRAAQFAHSFIKWTRKVLAGQLEEDGNAKVKLCSSAFKNLFSSAKVPKKDMDELVCSPQSTNMVVLCNGNIFSIEVVDKQEQTVLSVDGIEQQLNTILDAPPGFTIDHLDAVNGKLSQVPATPAILTTGDRNVWAEQREALEKEAENKVALGLIDAGILVICLDSSPCPTDTDKAGTLLIGDGSNRWYDKQQLVVTNDGKMGMTFEHSYSDGTGWGRFIKEVMSDIEGKDSGFSKLEAKTHDVGPAPHLIHFTLSEKLKQGITQASEAYQMLTADVDLVALNFDAFGKDEIKGWKVSPDAACQMAYQLTYYKVHGEMPPTYEACATRGFWHGRTETIRSCTVAAKEMCEAYVAKSAGLKEKFQAACAQHSKVSKDAATGQGIDRHLTALASFGSDPLFSDPLFVKSKTWGLSTSNGTAPFLDIFGFGAVDANGYGVGYLVGSKSISFCVSSYFSASKTQSDHFAKTLQETLLELKEVCTGTWPAAAPAAPAAAPAAAAAAPVSEGDAIMVLVLNCGSSSLKYALFDCTSDTSVNVVTGLVEKIGGGTGAIKHTDNLSEEKTTLELPLPDHKAALDQVIKLLMDPEKGRVKSAADIRAVGHRVVHGGESFTEATVITPEVKAAIEKASALAPLHNPANLTGVAVAEKLFACPQVAVFDTAFHMTMPPEAYLYAIPVHLYKEEGIRRYGFHGTSYKFVLAAACKEISKKPENANLIICHLGNGSSMAAIKKGKCVDTTMGLTPLEGLVMGTRSGDVDPALHRHLSASKGMGPDEVDKMLNKKSGLQGLCGASDMRAIQEKADAGDVDAKNAIGVFVHRVRKYLGSFLMALDGVVDALVFTAGIGENAFLIRELVCQSLFPLGFDLDKAKNASARGLNVISTPVSRSKILIVPTNEELSIAEQSLDVCGLQESRSKEAVMKRVMSVDAVPAAEGSVAEAPTAAAGPRTVKSLALCNITAKGTALVQVGILFSMMPKCGEIGFFRPFSNARMGGKDSHTSLIKDVFGLQDELDDMSVCTLDEAISMITAGRVDELKDMVVAAFEKYKQGKDFVLISASHSSPNNLELALLICSTLSIPLSLLYTFQDGDTAASASQQIDLHKAHVADSNVEVGGVVVTRVPKDKFPEYKAELQTALGSTPCIGIFPKSEKLSSVTMKEVQQYLKADTLLGHGLLDSAEASSVEVASGTVPSVIEKIKKSPGMLLFVDGSRWDMVFAVLLALQSVNVPQLAGIVMTGFDPAKADKSMMEVLNGLMNMSTSVVLLGTALSTIEAGGTLRSMNQVILSTSLSKLEVVQTHWERFGEAKFFSDLASKGVEFRMTPKLFQYNIMSISRKNLQHIVLPEGEDKRVVQAAGILVKRRLCKVTVLGDPEAVQALAHAHNADLTGVNLVDPRTAPDKEAFAEQLFKVREKKGMTLEKARSLVEDGNFYGTMMMYAGVADGMVSGACHTTADTMRPALQIIKTAPGFALVSSVFFMLLEKQVYVYGDCAINVNPDATQLGNIAASSALTAKAFGIDPRVALLSYATGESNKGELIDKVRSATATAKELAPGLAIEGPLQFDAAVDPAVAKVKVKTASDVAGKATVCIFPDLNTGNNTYKAVQQSSGCIAMGPIMQGLKKPVNDLSRGCTVDDIVNTVIITAVQAIGSKQASK